MRLTFSSSNYRNAELFDEGGHVVYTVRTTSGFSRKTTIERRSNHLIGGSHVVAVIHWHAFRSDKIHFKGAQMMNASDFLTKRWFSSDRHFVGPDGRRYKWKLHSSSRNCELRSEGSRGTTLAKYHKRRFGFLSPSHPAYLDISPSVAHMLDCVITTFVYVEKLSHDRHEASEAGAA